MALARIVTEKIHPEQRSGFEAYMAAKELSESTRYKYRIALDEYERFLGDRPVSHDTLTAWRDALLRENQYKPSTINGKVAAINAFFCSMDCKDCKAQLLTVQRQSYRDDTRDLNREEYMRLVQAAKDTGREDTELVLESICSMGIRVSELSALTVEALKARSIIILNKGKIRRILFPTALVRKLQTYAASRGITEGPVFRDKGNNPLNRFQIWGMLKSLCDAAGVDANKVFPHNLRHLFAKEYYGKYKDLVKLADILGHSNVSTTRIYLLDTGSEHVRQIDSLDLVL